MVIEEFLDGPEVSLFAVTDGVTTVPLKPAQDFKRARDGDQGPNTGGMGAYAPLPWASRGPADLADQAMAQVILPAVDTMRRRGTPYQGLLYAGLSLTRAGLAGGGVQRQVRRPGDAGGAGPAGSPLAPLLAAAAAGDLAGAAPLEWHPGAAVVVVIAADGYPEAPVRGDEIRGTERLQGPGHDHAYLLHAGTARDAEGALVAAGGRVLNAVGSGPDVAAARARAYELAGTI